MIDRTRPDVPPADSSETKEVFAFFGLCAYHAQVLEQGLLNLVVPLRLRGLTGLCPEDIEQTYVDNERRTLGQLIRDARQRVEIPERVAEALTEALRKRNYVAHSFFAQHSIDFMSEPGRREMIEELREITLQLQQADQEPITNSLWERLGMTRELFAETYAGMLAEAESRESGS